MSWEKLLNDVSSEVKPILAEFITTVINETGDEVKAYTEEAADYLATWLNSNALNTVTLEENLADIKATLQNMVVKHALQVHRETMKTLFATIDVVMKILVKTLTVALA